MKSNRLVCLLFLSLCACSTIPSRNKDSEFQIKPQEIDKNLEMDDQFLRKSQRNGSIAFKNHN